MGNGRNLNQTVIASAIALALLGVALAVGAEISGKPLAQTTPLVTTVLGFLASIIVALLAHAKADRVNRRLNGSLDELVQRRVEEIIAGRDQPSSRDPQSTSSTSSSSRSRPGAA